ncbi:DUF6438 domain-containing protein [Flavobacterium sp. DG1-102-2]|uniref:DUF6438 domain-containing protein n=1 Tax=Flavobacterium sp. DG1-102-2 TaxID=3081663 RepID=UPI002949330E|nr:DUF6438 domain-containing protein [Flavobacterium sp. DG1-102-2]MDV6169744.1 DUF6438 domain-containing protein [Flavobacterium sp. DG1-102-2]
MIRNLLVILVVLLSVSCEKKSQTPQEMLLGNWVQVVPKHLKGEIYIPTDEDTLAYEFKSNGMCDFKLAYFDHEAYMNDTVKTWNRVVPYLGTATKYKLEHKILKIYNPSKKKWDQYKIKKLTSDSLFIDDTLKTAFVKKRYPDDESPDFDTVILSTGGCFGPCPGNDIVIDRGGNVLFDGYYHVKNKGLYKGKISNEAFNKLSLRFRQADYSNLKSEYPLKYPHGSSTFLTFVKNGKILKTVKDDGTAPKEFVWAYRPLQYFEQQIELKRFKQKVYLEMKHPRVSFHDLSLYLEVIRLSIFITYLKWVEKLMKILKKNMRCITTTNS